MAMTLVGYQEAAAADVTRRYRRAITAFDEDAERTAISMSAPTGSGKTIMAAAIIEQLLFGGDGHPANPQLTVLWVSDNPSLNEQTRDKFVKFSSKFTLDRLVVVGDDDPLDVAAMAPGKVYFLNTQKLGAGSTSFQRGDGRNYGLWDVIAGTGKALGTDFLMVVDEAHRGTGRATAGGNTLLGRLVKGDASLRNPAPVVLGISATPERFVTLVGTALAISHVKVDVELVKESGLVKDKIVLAHPRETQAADATLLALAAHKRQEMALDWRAYTEAEGLSAVEPVLLVQVPAGESSGGIGQVLDALFQADGSLRDEQVVHALDTHKTELFGSHSVRWVEPSRIQEAPGVKVVVFKEALTTGWDCPRAEVMISLRRAEDSTYITQLIGRTVRTPLARRIDTVDALNSVWVFLPHFDATTVGRVVGLLGSGDDAVASDVEVNPVLLQPNPEVGQDVWDAFEQFPTNTRPTRTARNDVDRAISLGLILAGHGVKGVGKKAVQHTVVGTLDTFMGRDDVADFVEKAVADYESIDFSTLAVDWMTGEVIERTDSSTAVSVANVRDLFDAAKRKLPEASATWLWDHLCNTRFPDDIERARLYVAAAAFHPEVIATIEAAARALFDGWRRDHRSALMSDPDAQAQVTRLLAQSRASEPTVIARPDKASTKAADQWWDKHLLVSREGQLVSPDSAETFPAGKYPMKPNTWERPALEAELARPDVVAWYRNPTGGPQAIAVPYGQAGHQQMTYPDFVIFRRVDGTVVVDIVDPHNPAWEDTAAKWAALSRWARLVNAGTFDLEGTLDGLGRKPRLGRVWAIIDVGGELLYVDLLEDGIAERFAKIADEGEQQTAIRALFAERGSRL